MHQRKTAQQWDVEATFLVQQHFCFGEIPVQTKLLQPEHKIKVTIANGMKHNFCCSVLSAVGCTTGRVVITQNDVYFAAISSVLSPSQPPLGPL